MMVEDQYTVTDILSAAMQCGWVNMGMDGGTLYDHKGEAIMFVEGGLVVSLEELLDELAELR